LTHGDNQDGINEEVDLQACIEHKYHSKLENQRRIEEELMLEAENHRHMEEEEEDQHHIQEECNHV